MADVSSGSNLPCYRPMRAKPRGHGTRRKVKSTTNAVCEWPGNSHPVPNPSALAQSVYLLQPTGESSPMPRSNNVRFSCESHACVLSELLVGRYEEK